MSELLFSVVTDRGDVRRQNEDSVFAKTAVYNGHTIGMFAVADGCGGLDSGAEISALVTLRAAALFEKLVSGGEHDSPDRLLDSGLRSLNTELIDYFKNKGQRAGSTLSLLLVTDEEYIVKSIGDSRVYLLRQKKPVLLTEDQSLTSLRPATPENTGGALYSNVLTMCLGVFDEIEISTYRGRIRASDRFLICSDGLYKALDEKAMNELLMRGRKAIIGAADILRRGILPGKASDNVSVIVCGYRKATLFEKMKARLRRE